MNEAELLELYTMAPPETRKIVDIMLKKNMDYETVLDSCDGDINSLLEGSREGRC